MADPKWDGDFKPLDQPQAPDPAQALQSSVAYGATQNPDSYAQLLKLKAKTGLSPNVIHLQQPEVQQAADVNSLDYPQFAASHPRTTTWASQPDNAAVSGVDEIHRLANIELARNGLSVGPMPRPDLLNSMQPEKTLGNYFFMEPKPPAVDVSYRNLPDGSPERRQAELDDFYRQHPELRLSLKDQITPASAVRGFLDYATPAGAGTSAYDVPVGLGKIELAGFRGDRKLALEGGAQALEGVGTALSAGVGAGIVEAPLRTAGALAAYQIATEAGSKGAEALGWSPEAQRLVAAAVGVAPLGLELYGHHEAMARIIAEGEQSKLKQRSPEAFHDALSTMFEGDPSVRIPVDKFETYFQSKNLDPAVVAQQIGVKNYAEAKVSGGDVEVAHADYFGKLDTEHQKGLLPDVVNPATGMTFNQQNDASAELEKWVASGGPEKLSADTAQADAETKSSDEYQAVKSKLQQQYVDAGETPQVAENYATLQANVYSNLARETGMKASELMELYRPVMKVGEAPDTSLNQAAAGESPRGWFRVLPDGSFEIGKTKIGDLSTFIHEPAHSYLFMLSDLAKREGASDNLKGDYQKIMEFLGAKDGEALTTEQHEKWARANEQYLREGKAPSQRLKGVFQRFAVWLTSIYKRASDLGVGLSDDIRGVFDRMYAAEDGVNRAEKESGPQLVTDPETMGWTPEQFQAYADSKGMEVEQAKSEILGKLNEAAVRERTDAWREEEKNVREAVTTEVDDKQEYKAIRALRDGKLNDGTELSLNRDELIKQFGEDRVKELQKQHKGLYRIEGGADADTVAEMLGYGSGDEMLKKLTETPRRSQAIDSATRAYMTAKHGDIRYDGTLDDQARVALENDTKAANLHKELRQLRTKLEETKKAAGDQKSAAQAIKTAPIQAYRDEAKKAIQAKSAADMQPTRYLDASRKFSREAFDALRSGDIEGAAEAKHKELMNHFLFREATKAKENIAKYQAYGQRMSRTEELGKLGMAGQPFLDQIRAFLDRYSFRKVTDKSLRQENLSQFLTRMKDDENYEIPIDPMLLDETRQRNYREVPYSELTAVYDAMRSIEKAAKMVNSTAAEGKRVALDTAAAKLESKLFESLGEPKVRNASDSTRSWLDKFKDSTPDIAVILPEFTFERWDGLKKFGPWHEFFADRYNDAVDHKNRLLEKVWPQVERSIAAKIDRSRKFYIESMDVTLSKDDILSIAHNSGNESNLDKQMRGGLQFGKDLSPRPISGKALMEILSHLTPEDIDLVNSDWRALATLKPDAADLARRRSGIEPPWIEPKPLQVKNGTLEGGYWPVHFDPRFSAAGEKQVDTSLSVDKMFTQYASATTNQGYLIGRTGFAAPLSLDWQQTMGRSLNSVITDISHWEFVSDAQRLLKHPQTKTAIISRMGKIYYTNLLDWVRNTVKQGTIGAEASNTFEGFRRNMRSKVSTAVLGFRVANAVVETGITPILALQHVSAESSLHGVTTYLRNPIQATRFAAEASDYIRHIDTGIDRNVTEAMNQLTGDHSLMGDIRRWSIQSRVAIWKIGAVMAWHAGYHDAMKQGMEGKAAVRVADSIYRMTQESGRPGDLSAVQRDPRWNELTMFIGPSLIQYNNLRRSVMAFKDQGFTGRTAQLGVTTLLAGLAANTILFDALRGKAPDDKKKIPSWMAARMTFGMLDGLPLINQFSRYAEKKVLGEPGGDMNLIPALQVGKDAVDAALKTHKAFEGTTPWKGALKSDAKAVGSLTGLPMAQGSITGQYIYDVLSGEYKPAHPWSPVTDAFYARPPKK